MVEIGATAGVPLTESVQTGSEFHIGFGEGAMSATRRYTIGPSLRISLPHGFGVEFDALYKRLGFDDRQDTALILDYTRVIANSWEFPILATVRFLRRLPLKPYAAGGAAFRITSASSLSTYETFPGQTTPIQKQPAIRPSILDHRSWRGAAIGLGGQVQAGFLRISSEFRYTRWAADAAEDPFLHSNRNQAELLLGVGIKVHQIR